MASHGNERPDLQVKPEGAKAQTQPALRVAKDGNPSALGWSAGLSQSEAPPKKEERGGELQGLLWRSRKGSKQMAQSEKIQTLPSWPGQARPDQPRPPPLPHPI